MMLCSITQQKTFCVHALCLHMPSLAPQRLQVNSSSGKWCVTRVPLNGALSHPDVDHPMLEFVVHNGQGEWDKPQTGADRCMDCGRHSGQHTGASVIAFTLLPHQHL